MDALEMNYKKLKSNRYKANKQGPVLMQPYMQEVVEFIFNFACDIYQSQDLRLLKLSLTIIMDCLPSILKSLKESPNQAQV